MKNKKNEIFSYDEFYAIRDEVYNESNPTIKNTKDMINKLYVSKSDEEKKLIKLILKDVVSYKDTSSIMDRRILYFTIFITSFFSIIGFYIELIGKKDGIISTFICISMIIVIILLANINNNIIRENIKIKDSYRIASLYLNIIEEMENLRIV